MTSPVRSVLRVSRVVADLSRAARFYNEGLGFSLVRPTLVRLGWQEVELVQGEAGPGTFTAANDLGFQHLAIVVSDMDAAFTRLIAQTPAAISTGGPQLLPPDNGGVTAFKFRDPDGHPLELLHFPPGQGRALWRASGEGPFLGIDHSALAVSDTAASVAFYAGLGFTVAATSLNHGPAQSRLDGIENARVEVTSLRPPDGGSPGLELLCYAPPGRENRRPAASQWTTLLTPGSGEPAWLEDPDGHVLLAVSAAPAPPLRPPRRPLRRPADR